MLRLLSAPEKYYRGIEKLADTGVHFGLNKTPGAQLVTPSEWIKEFILVSRGGQIKNATRGAILK